VRISSLAGRPRWGTRGREGKRPTSHFSWNTYCQSPDGGQSLVRSVTTVHLIVPFISISESISTSRQLDRTHGNVSSGRHRLPEIDLLIRMRPIGVVVPDEHEASLCSAMSFQWGMTVKRVEGDTHTADPGVISGDDPHAEGTCDHPYRSDETSISRLAKPTDQAQSTYHPPHSHPWREYQSQWKNTSRLPTLQACQPSFPTGSGRTV
jgi:hypothetical protein